MTEYRKERSSTLVIVAFDIPEIQKKKRVWLRENLRALDLIMLQKSVWAGNVILPKAFIKEIRNQELLNYVHIFSVNRKGTIQKVSESNY